MGKKKKNNNIFHLKLYNYSMFPSIGFYFFVHSGLDPARSCVCSKHLWICSIEFESSDVFGWFGNIEVFLFKHNWSMGYLSNSE